MRRRAVLLTTRGDTSELEELVFALGADVAATVHQRRAQPDPQLYLGSGRMEEARRVVREARAHFVVVNGQLRPGQVFNLQRFFAAEGEAARKDAEPVEVYDRTRLILEIFRDRARSPEARLQVELAQLQYEMPLVREAISLSKKGERPGFLAGGEYEVNQYFDMMKKRMSRIRRDLEKMRHERGVRRKHRRRSGFHLVSLAGYTNAGKSSLLKALAQEHTVVENRYFSTLSTKTARARSDRREILVTDTVGFIEDLPPWMVEAFHSTLEEIALADVVLLVLDASDPVEEMSRKIRSSLRVLWEFDTQPAGAALQEPAPISGRASARGSATAAPTTDASRSAPALGAVDEDAPVANEDEEARGAWRLAPASAGAPIGPLSLLPTRRGLAPILVALNKVDRLPAGELEEKTARLEQEGVLEASSWISVSAKTGEGLDGLYERLYEMIPDYDAYEVALPPSPEAEALVAWLFDHTDVLDLTRGNETHVHFEAKRSLRTDLLARLEGARATALKEVVRSSGEATPERTSNSSDDPHEEGSPKPHPLISGEGSGEEGTAER